MKNLVILLVRFVIKVLRVGLYILGVYIFILLLAGIFYFIHDVLGLNTSISAAITIAVILIISVLGLAQENKNKTSGTSSSIPEPSLGPEWKYTGKNIDGTTYYINTKSITYLPDGIVQVWILDVPRGENKKNEVNDFKKYLLSKEENPSKAEKFWYSRGLYKINCATHQSALLEVVVYSFEETVLYSFSLPYEKWEDIVPDTLGENIEKYVSSLEKSNDDNKTSETPSSIPEPSLGPEWKLLYTYSDGTTYYINTKISHNTVQVWTVWVLWVPRRKFRRYYVNNILKEVLLSEGKDPSNAERFWYKNQLYKINCKTHQFAILESVYYSFEETVLYSDFVLYDWEDIDPGHVEEAIEQYVCKNANK